MGNYLIYHYATSFLNKYLSPQIGKFVENIYMIFMNHSFIKFDEYFVVCQLGKMIGKEAPHPSGLKL